MGNREGKGGGRRSGRRRKKSEKKRKREEDFKQSVTQNTKANSNAPVWLRPEQCVTYFNACAPCYKSYLIMHMRPPRPAFLALSFLPFAWPFGSLIAHYLLLISFEILERHPRSQLTTRAAFCFTATLPLSWALHGRRKVARVEVGLSLHLLLVVAEPAAPRQDGLAQEEEARRRRLEHHRNAPDEHRRVCLDERVPRE